MLSTVVPNSVIVSEISIATSNETLKVSISEDDSNNNLRIINELESEIILKGLTYNKISINFEIVGYPDENFFVAELRINNQNFNNSIHITFKQIKEKLFRIPSFQWSGYYPVSSFLQKIYLFSNHTESILVDYVMNNLSENFFGKIASFNINSFIIHSNQNNLIGTLSISIENMFKDSEINLKYLYRDEKNLQTLNYYDIIKWKKVNEIWSNFSNSSTFKSNFTFGFSTVLGVVNLTGEILLKNENFLSSDILDFGIVNKGEQSKMYIKYTNPFEYPIEVQVFLSEYPLFYYNEDLHIKKLKENCPEIPPNDIFNFLSGKKQFSTLQKCCYQLKSLKETLGDRFIQLPSNIEMLDELKEKNEQNSDYSICMELEIPEISCVSSQNQKANNLQNINQNSLQHICTYKYDSYNPQFEIEKRSKSYTINKNSSILIGPITFSPSINDLREISNYLIVKNDISFLSVTKLVGISGNGLVEISDLSANLDDLNNKYRAIEVNRGIRNLIIININEENIIERTPFLTNYIDSKNPFFQFLEGLFQNYLYQLREIYYIKIILRNVGNIPLNISKIFLNGILCQGRDFSISPCVIKGLGLNQYFIFEIMHLLDLGRVQRSLKLTFIVNNLPQSFLFNLKIDEDILSRLRDKGFLDW